MGPAVPRIKTNSELIKTLGSAFASGEQIYYGDIDIIDPKTNKRVKNYKNIKSEYIIKDNKQKRFNF